MDFVDSHACSYTEMMVNYTSVGLAVYEVPSLCLLKANKLYLSILDTFLAQRWQHGKALGLPLTTWGMDSNWGFNVAELGILAYFHQVAETKQPLKMAEYAVTTPKNGTTYWDWSLDPVYGENDCVTHIVQTCIEVTEQVLAREKSEQARIDLDRKNKLVEAERLRLEVIEALARSANESLNSERIGKTAVNVVQAHFQAQGVYLHIEDVIQKQLRLLCMYEHPDYTQALPSLRAVSYEQMLLGAQESLRREPVIVEDLHKIIAPVSGTDANPLLFSSAHGYIAVPLWFGDHCEGLLSLTFCEPIQAREIDKDLLLGCGTHIASALTHARLHTAVEQERNRLRAVLDQLPESILIAEVADGTISYANAAAAETLGLSRTQLMQRPFYRYPGVAHMNEEVISEGQRVPPWHFAVIGALCGETIKGKETLVVRPDGKQIITLTSSAPLYSPQGMMTGAVVVLQDVTEQKTLEQHKNEFLSIINHELRTPITIIQGFAEILQLKVAQENPLDTLSHYAITSITEQSQHLIQLIEEMLDLSRIEQAQFVLHRAPCNLLAIIEQVMKSQAITTRLHELYFNLEGLQPGSEIVGNVDEKRITQMLSNLISNAIKYSPQGGKVEVGVRVANAQPKEILLWIKDYGIGIAANEIEHIFRRFHRAKNVDSSLNGFGIGLYLVKKIVNSHGGRIWVESKEGMGSTFYVVLPLGVHSATGDN